LNHLSENILRSYTGNAHETGIVIARLEETSFIHLAYLELHVGVWLWTVFIWYAERIHLSCIREIRWKSDAPVA